MIHHRQTKAILYLAVAAAAMMVLAAGLPGLEFKPGLPIPGSNSTPQPASPVVEGGTRANGVELSMLVQGTLAIGFTLLILVFIISLLRKSNGKRIARLAAGAAILFALFLLLPRSMPSLRAASDGGAGAAPLQPLIYDIAPIGDPPLKLVWLVMAVLLTGAAALGAWALLQAFRRMRMEDDALASEAGAALQAIEAGEDLRNVIIRSYLQMARIVKEEQGIEREESVTPREFESLLAARGIPEAPIRQLTRLFEKARYGSKPADVQDEQAAVSCLSAIRASTRTERRADK